MRLQCHASRHKWQFSIQGQFKQSLHLVLSLAPDASLNAFLTETMKDCFLKAGFANWSFPEGCSDPDIRINIERYLSFDRK